MGSATAAAKRAPASCEGCPLHATCTISRLLSGRRMDRGVPQRRLVRARQVLFQEGTASSELLVVVAGVVAIRKQEQDGGSLLLELAYPGHRLDYGALFPRAIHHSSAIATFDVEVCATPAKAMRDAVRSGGAAALALTQQVAQELERRQESLLLRVTVPSQIRLLHALLLLAQHHGVQREDGTWQVELPVKRCDLASMVGTRPETISRIVRAIEDADLAHFNGRHVIIPRLDALRGLAAEERLAGVATPRGTMAAQV